MRAWPIGAPMNNRPAWCTNRCSAGTDGAWSRRRRDRCSTATGKSPIPPRPGRGSALSCRGRAHARQPAGVALRALLPPTGTIGRPGRLQCSFSASTSATVPSTPALRYHRYDPVLAPVVVPRRAVTPGESAHILVVRTDNSNAATPVAGPTCERHLLAPKAAVATLESHGMLDVAGQSRPDPAVYALLFEHDAAVVTGTPDPGASQPYVDADTVPLPWLPDPIATGVTIVGLSATPQISQPWAQGDSWYQRGSLRLVLAAGDQTAAGAAVVDPTAETITITLAPGSVSAVNISSSLATGGEELMGAWDWFTAGASPDTVAAMQAAASAGTLGQLTPALQCSWCTRCAARTCSRRSETWQPAAPPARPATSFPMMISKPIAPQRILCMHTLNGATLSTTQTSPPR